MSARPQAAPESELLLRQLSQLFAEAKGRPNRHLIVLEWNVFITLFWSFSH